MPTCITKVRLDGKPRDLEQTKSTYFSTYIPSYSMYLHKPTQMTNLSWRWTDELSRPPGSAQSERDTASAGTNIGHTQYFFVNRSKCDFISCRGVRPVSLVWLEGIFILVSGI